MKARPQATLVLIPAQFTLGFFVILLHPVPPMGIFHQRAQWRAWWKIAPEVFPVASGTACGTLSHEPPNASLTFPIYAPTANSHKARFQPTRAAFVPTHGCPRMFRVMGDE